MKDYTKVIDYNLFYFIVDTCGGMVGEKIGIINNSIQELFPQIRALSDDGYMKSYIKVMGYGTGAYWVDENPVLVEDYCWRDLVGGGCADLGAALSLLSEDMDRIKVSLGKKNFHPIIILITGSDPTDNVFIKLDELKQKKWFTRKALKIAITIGDNLDTDLLKDFTGNLEFVMPANSMIHIPKLIRWDDDCAFDEDDYEYVSDFSELYIMRNQKESHTSSPLQEIIERYPKVWEEPKRIKSLLMDFYPGDKLQRNLILASVEENIPHELFEMGVCSKANEHRYIRRLVDAHGCSEAKSEEIIQLWLEVFNVTIEDTNQRKLTNQEIEAMSFDEIELPVRVYNQLKRAGINTVAELMRPREEEMMGVRNLGRKTLETVIEELKKLGWTEVGEYIEPSKNKMPMKSDEMDLANLVMGARKLPVKQETKEDDLEHTHVGRAKCDQLREIRKKIADANGIDFEPAECHHTGPCLGTCPVCDAEIQYIDDELQKKKDRGEEIILSGLAADDIKKSGCNTNPEVDIDVVDGGIDTFEMGMDNIPDPDINTDDEWGGW